MTGPKTNERPGTRAVIRYIPISAYKARAVLDLIRGKDVRSAEEILRFCERDAANVISKALHSAMANAEHNDSQDPEELFVSACFADEGKTARRFRPRARGRASRIRKRSCHITIVVSRMSEQDLEKRRIKDEARPGSRAARRAGQEAAEARKRRTRASREAAQAADHEGHDHEPVEDVATEEVAADEAVEVAEVGTDEAVEAEAEAVATDEVDEAVVKDSAEGTPGDSQGEEN
ncbi:MAG: 50S ribosomal protein L22 [Acidimicrobiales bacterium]